MSNHRTFHGLKRLVAKAGLSPRPGANADPAPADPVDDEDDEDGEDAALAPDPADPAPAPDPVDPVPADPVVPADDEDDEPADPAPAADTTSTDYRAGVTATNGRWAAVFASEHARANLELATDLLADTTMKPSAIIGMCERHKAGTKPGLQSLASTPRPNLGGATAGAGGAAAGGDPGKAARSGAAARANARVAGKPGVKTKRGGGRAAKQEG